MPFHYKTIKDIGDIKGRRVILLADFSVPFEGDKVVDDYRIVKTLPTIEFLKKQGAVITIISKIGDDGSVSLKPVSEYLETILKQKIYFAETTEEAKSKGDGAKEGDIVMLENIRHYKGEKENSPEFAEKLASLGELFVNEAFSVSHRPYASVVGVPKLLPSYIGLQFALEVENLSKAFNPIHPFVLVLGGKKAETKTPLIEHFLHSADKIFIGGAIANDFFRAKGFSVGKSVVSKENLINENWISNEKIILPKKVLVNDGANSNEVSADSIPAQSRIVDMGKDFAEELKIAVSDARLIIWNGTLGICEQGFKRGTEDFARIISESGAFTIVGGGDTVLALNSFGLANKFSFVSTGGGAMLEFLAKETLPGIKALEGKMNT